MKEENRKKLVCSFKIKVGKKSISKISVIANKLVFEKSKTTKKKWCNKNPKTIKNYFFFSGLKQKF